MLSRIRIGLAAFFTIWCGAVEAAPTKTLPSEDGGAARTRYEEAVSLYQRGKYPDAIRLFREADRIEPSAAFSFDIARAYEHIGDDAGALAAFREYLRRAPTAPDAPAVRSRAREIEGRLGARGVQQVSVLSTPRGATVSLDGDAVGITPWTHEIAPGDYTILLHLEGHRDATRRLHLTTAEAVDVSVSLAPEGPGSPKAQPPAPPPADPEAQPTAKPLAPPAPPPAMVEGDDSRHRAVTTAGFIILGAGGLSLGGALAFELARQSAENSAKNEHEQIRLTEDMDTARHRRDAARALLGGGLGLVVIGGALVAFAPSDRNGKDLAPNVTFDVAPSRLGATLRGRF